MAYNKELGFDPDLDYTELYKTAPDDAARTSIVDQRAKKKEYMTAIGTYKPEYDTSWDSVYNLNPVMGYDASNPYAGYGSTVNNQSSNPYAATQKQAEDLLQKNTQTQIGQANTLYDNEAKQAYISREQQMKNLPTQLAAQGITGGMAETSAVRVGTDYNNRVATSEAARQGAISNINIASGQQAMDMALAYADRVIAQQNADRSYNRGVFESDRGFGADQTQRVFDNSLKTNAYQDEKTAEAKNDMFTYATMSGDYSGMKQYGWTDDMVGNMNKIASDEKGKLKTQEEKDAYDSGLASALEKAALTGDYSGLKKFGYSDSDIAKANALVASAYSSGPTDDSTSYNRALDAAETSGDYSVMSPWWPPEQIASANANAKGTTTTTTAATEPNPYSLPKYAQAIIDQYEAKDGYDIKGALSSAVSAGRLTQADADAVLSLLGLQNSSSGTNASSIGQTNADKADARIDNPYTAGSTGWVDNPGNLGYGPISENRLRELIDNGEVEGKYENGRIIYRRIK